MNFQTSIIMCKMLIFSGVDLFVDDFVQKFQTYSPKFVGGAFMVMIVP